MKFTPTTLRGAYLIEIEKMTDERGWFGRSWCREEFADHGLDPDLAQCNVSFNNKRGTLRGMHYQLPPFAETKLVRCTSGAVFDVIIDLRPDSPTFLRWFGATLTPGHATTMYVPKGFAHGFQTLEDNSEVFYQMSTVYAADSARGVRWNDPLFGVQWPGADRVISRKDQEYGDSVPGQFSPLAGLYQKSIREA